MKTMGLTKELLDAHIKKCRIEEAKIQNEIRLENIINAKLIAEIGKNIKQCTEQEIKKHLACCVCGKKLTKLALEIKNE